MKTNLEIITREATAGDLGGISEVFLRARKELMPFAPLAHSDYAVCRWIADWLIPTGGVSVATDAQGLILGMMATSEADGVLWLDQLYVSPPWVGHGIGARLLALVISNTRLPVHLHCFAIAFGDGSDNEEGCPDVVYALQPAPQIDGCESS
jgi:GNAT superfamily N-acetyltransferase